MRILLTGATGFVGQELLKRLLDQRHTVRVLVRPDTLAKSEDARRLSHRRGVEVVPGTLLDADPVMRAHQDVDTVYHLGWHSKRRSQNEQGGEDPAQINQQAAEHIVEACAKHKVGRLVFTSSVAVYGPSSDVSQWPITEETPLYEGPRGGTYLLNYIQPKVNIEKRISQAALKSGFEYVILRPPIVYGIGWHGAERLMQRALQGPDQARPRTAQAPLHLIHVRDMAKACLLAGTHVAAAGRTFNVAGPETATIEEMIQMIRSALFRLSRGLPLPRRRLVRPQEYPRYDTTKAHMFLNFSPQVTLQEGLAEMASPFVYRPYERASRASQQASPMSRQAITVGHIYDKRLYSDLVDEYYDYSDFWNWGYWDEDTISQAEACKNLMEELLGFLPKKRGTILDVACGKGATTRYLLEYYSPKDVTGINITEQQLQICRRNAPNCRFLLMDATRLEFEDNTFDNIICVEAAGHFDTREQFLREARRVLKAGGRLVLSDAIFSPRRWMSPQHGRLVAANFVRDAEEYRNVCLKAGFSDAIARDATSACWKGFSENFTHYLEDKLATGDIDWRAYAMCLGWHRRLASSLQFYVLACCIK